MVDRRRQFGAPEVGPGKAHRPRDAFADRRHQRRLSTALTAARCEGRDEYRPAKQGSDF
jgi:hypothetical protein